MNLTKRTELHRLPKRGSHELRVIYEILDAAFLAHVGFAINGQPFVIPTLFGREDDKLYLHGSAASRMLGELAAGVPACVTVTIVDGLVLARSAFHHSMNYRSVVAFGTACRINQPARQLHALQLISEHLIRGRWKDVRGPTAKELKATSVLEFSIDEASAKVRTGPPLDDEEDYARPVWAGVIPLKLALKEPLPDSRLPNNREIPQYIFPSEESPGDCPLEEEAKKR